MSDLIGKAVADAAAGLPYREECGAVAVPSRRAVIKMIKQIQTLFFPAFFPPESGELPEKETLLRSIGDRMRDEIFAAFRFLGDPRAEQSDAIAAKILSTLPDIRRKLLLDAEAIYEGDPAAPSKAAVIFSYPGFLAITVYRVAHEFYLCGVPFLDRILTEYAHEKTGIDIHAGAAIGEYFFIDHGTGIVIGETTTIGDHVKLYQGVTLGAKSFELDDQGNPIKGTKRHPDIGNHVIIYANATILGGNTKIGDGSVVGGNVWLTHSIEPGTVAYYNERS